MFAHLGTFCGFSFPIDKKHLCSHNLFYDGYGLNAAWLLYPLYNFVPLVFCGVFFSLF